MIAKQGKHAKLWAQARRLFVKNNPDKICAHCGGWATDVDHIKKRSTHPELRYVQSNLQWLCRPCHSRKDA
jgi:thymidylate synthase (FAD)